MSNIKANVTKMFSNLEPWDCSNNAATMGESVAQITWRNATAIAAKHEQWLETPLADAAEHMRDWARSTGAWDREETQAWSDVYSLALFVQNVASELRMLGSDDNDFETCVETYESTDWEHESEYPAGVYLLEFNGSTHEVKVDYYTGS